MRRLNFPLADYETILTTMRQELQRSFKGLRVKNFESPYFISYLGRFVNQWNAYGRYGALYARGAQSFGQIYAEVRVGSYAFDNVIDGGLADQPLERPSTSLVMNAPMESIQNALRRHLWQLTDIRYKEALEQLLEKKRRALQDATPRKNSLDFSKERPSHFVDLPEQLPIPNDHWLDLIRKYSQHLKQYKEFIDSYMQISIDRIVKCYVNTEGSQIITHYDYYHLVAHAVTKADDGADLNRVWTNYFSKADEFPAESAIEEALDNLAERLLQLRKAKVLTPYSGPAILCPESAGVFFHEVIGHRMEGERLISPEEGQTFKGKLGTQVFPKFISIVDDPTITDWKGHSLIGTYLYDDEGVKAKKVALVKKGVLKNFLLSRTPVEQFTKSNGHGRNESFEDPIARMSNLIVHSSRGYSFAKLKEKLLAEVNSQKKPYGLIIQEVGSGETQTTKYGFQAFRGTPTMVYKVDCDSGKETLVRGIEFVGTPLASMNKIIATGNDYTLCNKYCNAESGWVPVSTIAPSILISEIELQKVQETRTKPPILPPPPL